MKQSKAEFYKVVFDLFRKNNPLPQTELRYENPFQLLVAVVLSAQCTDERVNQITPKLFRYYPDAESMSKASEKEIFELIKTCSYPNSKTRYLHAIANHIVTKFNNKIPDTVEELTTLPGVGRKTANVILSVLYQKPVIAVDTHVFRVSQRIGLVDYTRSFRRVEEELATYIPPDQRAHAHHWLILHGRYICKARKPLCHQCFLTNLCLYFNKS
ncbi:MAG: endonuclease III [Bacteroidales bacterium]|nr:endonuclease III [Bacteroidales bacterium]